MGRLCYYAHSKHLYGSAQEERDIEAIEKAFDCDVLDPNLAYYERKCKEWDNPMDYFTEVLVPRCDFLVFRSTPDMSITAGVFQEIIKMQSLGRPVFELPSSITMRGMTVEQTREFLEQIGYR